MAQQEKITKRLDLRNRASIRGKQVLTKTAHYSVTVEDSGKMLVANNSGQPIFFTLPLVNTGEGCTFSFFNINTASMTVNSAESGGAIFSGASLNGAHLVNCVNLGDTQRLAKAAYVWGDGTRWLLQAPFISNTDRIVQG